MRKIPCGHCGLPLRPRNAIDAEAGAIPAEQLRRSPETTELRSPQLLAGVVAAQEASDPGSGGAYSFWSVVDTGALEALSLQRASLRSLRYADHSARGRRCRNHAARA
jgi:hypothetical protein